jgi:hypothetical protein
LDDLVDALDVGLVDDRAHLAPGVRRGADLHRLQPGGELGPDPVGDPLVHQKSAARHAELPGEDDQRTDHDRKRLIEVGVLEQDQRRLSAQLQPDALEVFRRRWASLGPPIAYEPITSPVAGLTESRCSSESAHLPSIQCIATGAAVVLISFS